MKLTLEQEFQESLAASLQDADEDKDQYLGTRSLSIVGFNCNANRNRNFAPRIYS